MDKPDWTKEGDYAFTNEINDNNEAWTWEFLRRNPKYIESWKRFQAEAKAYEGTLGKDWAKNKKSWQRIPPMLPDETSLEWLDRCGPTEPEFEHCPLEEYYARKWGLALRIPDPSISFLNMDQKPRFLEPHPYPKLITDNVSFSAHLMADDEFPFQEVDPQYGIIAFDLGRSLENQIIQAATILGRQKKWATTHQSSRHRGSWPLYLMVLDAALDGVKSAEVGLTLKMASDNEHPGYKAKNRAKSCLNRARKVMRNYMAIMEPF